MATTWPHADEIDVCNGDVIVAIIKVVARNTIPNENYLILQEDLFGSEP
jgi:hypothetical protein